MPRKIIFFIRSLLLSLVIIGNVIAAEISIIPVKKPILNEEVKREKISQGDP
jgi:soluble lytic murein transglycosylase